MSSNEIIDPNSYTTFEITVPSSSEGAMTALRGIAGAFSLSTRQRPALPSDLDNSLPISWQVTNEQFLETSQILWGVTNYGRSAISHVRTEEDYVGVAMWANGTVNLAPVPEDLQNVEVAGAPFIPLWINGELQEHTGYNLSDEAMLTRARVFWDHRHTPFTLKTSFSNAISFAPRGINLSTGVITRERLADYARTRRYDQHSLRGTLGKMLDTICVTGGVVRKADIDIGGRTVDTEFVESKTLAQMLTASRLSKQTINGIHTRIDTAIDNQLSSGQPYKHGEVIIEGVFEGRDHTYERIATSSLAALAQGYTGAKRDSAPAQFLSQF